MSYLDPSVKKSSVESQYLGDDNNLATEDGQIDNTHDAGSGSDPRRRNYLDRITLKSLQMNFPEKLPKGFMNCDLRVLVTALLRIQINSCISACPLAEEI